MSLTDTFDNPQSRVEAILQNAMGAEHEVVPQSRVEELLERLDGYLEQLEDEIEEGAVTPEELSEAVDNWLNAHPEATTTVQDGSLTEAKFTNALKLKTIKDYVTPEMFGAVGDGATDDTEAIRQACASGVDAVVFHDKTYIINITAGTNNTDARNFFLCTCTSLIGIGNATIKLGSDNGNTTIYKGYESIFKFTDAKNIIVENLTFDFNYDANPIYQYTSNHVGVEVNGQQMAINGYGVKSLCVNDCVFLEHSGTNCINLRTANTDGIYAKITNCKFMQTGKKSIYNDSDAYHDCSTISLHVSTDTTSDSERLTAIVSGCTFEGVGGNAFDACECSAGEFYFENNTVDGYVVGVMPLTAYVNTHAHIINNVLQNVAIGVGVWNNNIDTTLAGGVVGFEYLEIASNYINVNIPLHLSRPNFETINSVSDEYYIGIICSAVRCMGNFTKSFGVVSILNNDIYFEDVSSIANGYFASIYDGNAINFYLLYGGSSAPTSAVSYDGFIVKGNKFTNLPNAVLMLNPFSQHGSLVFEDNVIDGCWKRAIAQGTINSGLIRILVKDDGGFDKKVKLISICRNDVIYSGYTSSVYGVVFIDTSVLSSFAENLAENGGRIVIVDNITAKPYYGLYKINSDTFAEKFVSEINVTT